MNVNLNSLKDSTLKIEVPEIIQFGENLILETTSEYSKEIVPGDKITYRRYFASSAETEPIVDEEYIVSSTTGVFIYVASPVDFKRRNVISNYYAIQNMPADKTVVSGNVETYVDNEIFYRFNLDSSFDFLQSDILTARGLENNGLFLRVISDVDTDSEGNLIDFLFNVYDFYSDDFGDKNSHYIYIKCTEEQAKLIASKNCYMISNYNHLFCPMLNENDILWDKINNDTVCYFTKNNASLNIGLTLESNSDFSTLYQEEHIEDIYNDRVKSTLIPDLIDMERVRYTPHMCDESGNTLEQIAETINFHVHLRHREMVRCSGETTIGNIKQGDETFEFEDNWYVNPDIDTYAKYWNTYNDYTYIYPDTRDYYSSDPIGFLNFKDSDILYQKNKVKKSFIRLSFYNSNNPGTTSLLFYSTIFLDSTALYSKLIKLMNSDADIDEDASDAGFGYTLFSASTDTDSLLTCGFSVSNEYDETKSSEGYNLYLFRDDAPLENSARTIYMKVEFNHAGYGRTVPLILWPFDDEGKPKKLKLSNYYESLYIPVEIQYINNKYVYTIKGARNNLMDGVIDLALFEPKFQPDAESD